MRCAQLMAAGVPDPLCALAVNITTVKAVVWPPVTCLLGK